MRELNAKVCLQRPTADGGYEFVCSLVVALEGLPKGTLDVYRVLIPSCVGVAVGWQVIVANAYRVTSVTPTAQGDWAILSQPG